ncbi:Uncharacterised protein [Vibrio cholerae]|nr:Uncharacterised protein [Vibrio cholerae]
MAYNKLLNFVPATNSVASTGLPTLCFGSPLVMRYACQSVRVAGLSGRCRDRQ